MPKSKEPRHNGKGDRASDRVDRRKFLATATGFAGASLLAKGDEARAAAKPARPVEGSVSPLLALDGGTPVRATMLEAKLSGPQYYDDEERRELQEVLENRSPFRWWGLNAKVLGQPARMKLFAGGQFRMSEFTAAVLRAQLRKLDRIVGDFRDKTTRVTAGIADLPGVQLVTRLCGSVGQVVATMIPRGGIIVGSGVEVGEGFYSPPAFERIRSVRVVRR